MKRSAATMTTMILAAALPAWAANVTVRLEARGLGSVVDYADIADGFILDVIFEADEPMVSGDVYIDGDPRFGYDAMETFFGAAIRNYADQANSEPPVSTAGWALTPATAIVLENSGSLPLEGGLNDQLGTIAEDLVNGASNGLFAWLRFSSVPPAGQYVITASQGTAVGDLSFNAMNLTVVPLLIGGAQPPDDGDPGNGDPGNGDPGNGDPGNGDPGDGDPGDGDPGDGDPGDGDPGDGDPGTGVRRPTCAPAIGQAAAMVMIGLFFMGRTRRR